jgi:hypothetical protein
MEVAHEFAIDLCLHTKTSPDFSQNSPQRRLLKSSRRDTQRQTGSETAIAQRRSRIAANAGLQRSTVPAVYDNAQSMATKRPGSEKQKLR